MMWFAILTFALACSALISVGAVVVVLVSITNALARRPEFVRR